MSIAVASPTITLPPSNLPELADSLRSRNATVSKREEKCNELHIVFY
jgi:hypothetical protein